MPQTTGESSISTSFPEDLEEAGIRTTLENSLDSKKTHVCSSEYFVEMSSNKSSILFVNEAFTSSKSAGLAGLRNKNKKSYR